MIKVWESIDNNNLSQSINWTKFKFLLKLLKLREVGAQIKQKLFSLGFGSYKENYKFPPLDRNDVHERIKRLQKVLGIGEKLQCNLLSERTILIKNFNRH